MPTTDTFSITAGANDSSALSGTNAVYASLAYSSHNPTNNVVSAARDFSGGLYDLSVGLLRFDTSALPDNANVTSALLRIYVTSKVNANTRDIIGEYFSWAGSGSGDWTATPPGSPVLSMAIASLPASGSADISLTDFTGISKTGNTSLRLHVSGGVPTGLNWVQFAAYDHVSNPEPQLLVTYELGGDLVGMVGI